MAISEEQVKHVAKLAKLAFADEELASFTDQLGKIIDMVEMLEEVDTEGVPFTSNVVEMGRLAHNDRITQSFSRRTASYACIERNHCTRFDKNNI